MTMLTVQTLCFGLRNPHNDMGTRADVYKRSPRMNLTLACKATRNMKDFLSVCVIVSHNQTD